MEEWREAMERSEMKEEEKKEEMRRVKKDLLEGKKYAQLAKVIQFMVRETAEMKGKDEM